MLATASTPVRVLSLAVLLALAAADAMAQQRVGVSSAVNQEATGTPPGAPARRLVIGQEVVFNERIVTTTGGQTQLLFLDESTITVGPNADLTIDQFVYDPNSGTGRMALSTARGVLRFVGGKLSKQEDAISVRTPAATIAVRGGAFLMEQGPDGRLDVFFIYGNALTVFGANGIAQSIRRPGFAITVSGPGAAPTQPYPAPPGRVAQLLALLDGRPGASGGARQVPSDATVVGSGLPDVVSGNLAYSIAAASATQPFPPLPPRPDAATLQTNLEVNTVQAQGSGIIQPPGVLVRYTDPQLLITNQTSIANVPVVNASLQQAGTMAVTVRGGSGAFPLPSGHASFGPQSASSTVGPLAGTTFRAPDNAFFYSVFTAPNFPGYAGVLLGGVPTVNLPATGTGFYSGPATGSVFNNGASYIANGTFTNNYNFGTNTGSFAVNNFDNRNFAGTVHGAGASYSGTLTGGGTSASGSTLAGPVVGKFYGPNAGDTGGAFSVQSIAGPPYSATAAFGGVRIR